MNSQKLLFQKNRRNILFFALVLTAGFCLLTFSAASSAQQADSNAITTTNANVAPTLEPLKSVVRGRIVYENTGRPVRRSAFSLVSIKNGPAKSGLTDDNGDFVLKDIPEGKYYTVIVAPGVLNLISFIDFSAKSEINAFENAREEISKNFEEIIVAPGSDTQIFVRAKQGGAIGGRVYYADGAPAINVKVEMLRKTNDKFIGVISNLADINSPGRDISGVKTDDRGIYRASGLPPGEYLVKASEPAAHSGDSDYNGSPFGFGAGSASLLSTYHPDASEADKAVTVTLEIGQETGEINITLPDRAFFSAVGKVVAKGTQNPVPKARISIKRKEAIFSFSDRLSDERGVAVGEQGDWNLKDLPAGTYILSVKPPDNYGDIEYDEDGKPKPNQKLKPKFAPIEKEITITDKSLTDVKIELSLGGRISGVVTGENKTLPNSLQIQAFNDKGESVASASARSYDYTTDKPLANPEFALENLPTGSFFLNFTANNYRGNQVGEDKAIYYLKSIKTAAKDYFNAPVEITEGSNVEKVQIMLGSDGGRLKGKIKEKDDQPAVGKRIVLVPTDENKWRLHSMRLTGSTDAKGEFEVAGAPIEYFVFILTAQDKLSAVNEAWIRERSGAAEKVTIKASGQTDVTLVAR